MVRRCAVPNCTETDKSTLAHRFPKDNTIAVQWQKALNLEESSLDNLCRSFTVCTKHFANNSYRNETSNCLNTTAIPSLEPHEDNPRCNGNKKRDKSLTPLRCFKRPSSTRSSVSNSPQQQATVLEIKKIKIDPDQLKDEEQAPEVQKEEEESVETGIERLFEEVNDNLQQNGNDTETSSAATEESSKSPTPTLEHELPLPTFFNTNNINRRKFFKRDAQTQTDETHDPDEIVENHTKDDETIKELYPEFSKFTKLQLINIISDKNDAIRKLLN